MGAMATTEAACPVLSHHSDREVAEVARTENIKLLIITIGATCECNNSMWPFLLLTYLVCNNIIFL